MDIIVKTKKSIQEREYSMIATVAFCGGLALFIVWVYLTWINSP